jgi:hypothetical protein
MPIALKSLRASIPTISKEGQRFLFDVEGDIDGRTGPAMCGSLAGILAT